MNSGIFATTSDAPHAHHVLIPPKEAGWHCWKLKLGAMFMSRQQHEHAAWQRTRIHVRPAGAMRTWHPALLAHGRSRGGEGRGEGPANTLATEDDCAPSDDTNRTTQYTYNADGSQVTMTAVNSWTGNQTTTYTYGTTLTDSVT